MPALGKVLKFYQSVSSWVNRDQNSINLVGPSGELNKITCGKPLSMATGTFNKIFNCYCCCF